MFTKHAPRSNALRQLMLMVVLLLLVFIAVGWIVNLHSSISPSSIAASWGNDECESSPFGTCPPRLMIAASWGNAAPTPPRQ